MKKRIFALFSALILTVCFSFCPTANVFAVTESSAACCVMDAATGELLYAKNENDRLPMASTTKIMTALLALESGNLDEEFTVTDNMIGVGGTSMYLVVGDTVTMRTLVYGMLLNSGNDAANAAAVKIAGSLESFVKMMNERAEKMGLTNTHFVNPEGLDAENHYSSAKDLAMLGAEALKNPDFAEICSTKSTTRDYGNPPYTHYLTNHNKLLRYNMVEGINGIKTGFTDNAGRCLVSGAKRDCVQLICVTLNDADDWNDHVNLLEYGFSLYSEYDADTTLDGVNMPVVGGDSQTIGICCEDIKKVKLRTGTENKTERTVKVPLFVYAPISQGEQVGSIEYTYNGEVVASIPVLAGESCSAVTSGWFSSLAAALAAVE